MLEIEGENSNYRFKVQANNEFGCEYYCLAYLVELKESCWNCGKSSCSIANKESDKRYICEEWTPKRNIFRPFKNIDELFSTYGKKQTNVNAMPLIWVRHKNNNAIYLISGFDRADNQVLFYLDWISCTTCRNRKVV